MRSNSPAATVMLFSSHRLFANVRINANAISTREFIVIPCKRFSSPLPLRERADACTHARGEGYSDVPLVIRPYPSPGERVRSSALSLKGERGNGHDSVLFLIH